MNKTFLIFIVGFLVFVFLLEWNAPSKFVWGPTFSHHDKQPFGCEVFDSLMKKSVPAGYEVTRKTLSQLEREGYGKKPHGFLIQSIDFNPSPTDLRALDRLLKAGNKVFIATSSIDPDSLYPDLQLTISGQYVFSPMQVKASIENQEIPYDTLVWCRQSPYQEKKYTLYSAMSGDKVDVDKPAKYDILVKNRQTDEYTDKVDSYWVPRVVRIQRGKGELFFSCEPLLLTNYGILDEQANGLVFWLQNEPLRWAIYLTLGGLLLFCVFYARRRQRVIPVVEEPKNRSLEFVKLIGTLYYQKHINHDLLQKKYAYFTETLRRLMMVDVEDTETRKDDIAQIALRAGMPEAEVRMILDRVDHYLKADEYINDAALRKAIDGMDKIINNLLM